MDRRSFFARTSLAAAGLTLAPSLTASQGGAPSPRKPGRFRLKYAPSFGQFKAHAGDDLAAQIQFCADQGFTAMFDNGIMGRPVGRAGADRPRAAPSAGMPLGPFVLYADFAVKSFVMSDKDIRAMLLQKMRRASRR